MESIGRRRFLATTAGGGLAGILAARVPPARGQQREISYLCWNNFAPEMEKKHGKTLSSGYEAAHVNGVWRAVPMYHGLFVPTYREDLFKRAGLKVPDTWEELYTVGKELKKMGNPVGIPISQNYDSISTAGTALGMVRRVGDLKDGQTGRNNTPASVPSIDWDHQNILGCIEADDVSLSDPRTNDSIR